MGESTYTYETLFEIVRNEKTSENLQKITPGTLSGIARYLQQKLLILKQANEAEKANLKIEVNNVRKLIKDLIQRRQKKVINLAFNNSFTNGSINTEGMVKEEIQLFEHLIERFSRYNKETLLNLLNAKYAEPEIPPEEPKPVPEPESRSIIILEEIPAFVGENLETLGPFRPDEKVTLTPRITEILISKGAARYAD